MRDPVMPYACNDADFPNLEPASGRDAIINRGRSSRTGLTHLLLAAWMLSLLGACSGAWACDAEVEEKYCQYFYKFQAEGTVNDVRISKEIGTDGSTVVRSVAFVIVNSLYPNINTNDPGGKIPETLEAAGKDLEHLKDFLWNDQKFDEIIVLENGQATSANIHYFMASYLPQVGRNHFRKARLLIAYSGHGDTSDGNPSLVLSDAKGLADVEHLYPMAQLRQEIEKLNPWYFHVVTLLNACFGGNLFGTTHGGGNDNVTNEPGSYALTAGPENKNTYGNPNGDGSLFFDSLIQGIKAGEADPDYQRYATRQGKVLTVGGLTRFGPLASYLTSEMDVWVPGPNNIKIKVSPPYHSAIEQGDIARGAFFFISPYKAAPAEIAAAGLTDVSFPTGPRSSVFGRPDVKVFKAPAEYPIKGIDVSRFEGNIDWKRVAKWGARFAYIRATSPLGTDPRFLEHLHNASSHKIDRGAYTVFDFCVDPDVQLNRLTKIVPNDDDLLPIAIDVEIFPNKQALCMEDDGVAGVRAKILRYARKLQSYYRKTPIIYGNRSILNRYITSEPRFDEFSLWLAVWQAKSAPNPRNIELKGSNPWTLWQFTGAASVPGIGDNVDVSVFYGTEDEYRAFKTGDLNVALQAALPYEIKGLKERMAPVPQ